MEVSDNAVVVFTATCELGQVLWKEVDVYLPRIITSIERYLAVLLAVFTAKCELGMV